MSMLAEARPPQAPPWRAGAAVALQGCILGTFFAASAAPTPLYRLYQEQWGFSPAMLTVIFAVYALSLLVALLTVGALSDYVGRRPVMCAALVLEIVAMLLFERADGVGDLIAARLVQGFATGAASSVLGAALIDSSRRHGAIINSISPLVGMAVGGMGAAFLAAYVSAPTLVIYRVFLSAFALQAVLLWGTRETVTLRSGALASLWPRVEVPPAARTALVRITPLNVAIWSVGGFSLSLMPSLVRMATGIATPLLGGLLVGALTLPGAAAVLLLRQRSARTARTLGALFLAGGFAVILAGVHAGAAQVLIAGMMITGIGFGGGFLGAVRTVVPLAAPEERGALLSAFYVESYLALSLPAIAAGRLAGDLGLQATADVYGAFVITLAVIGVLAQPR
nr:MFS transporter [Azorhizobium doebereinerae]